MHALARLRARRAGHRDRTPRTTGTARLSPSRSHPLTHHGRVWPWPLVLVVLAVAGCQRAGQVPSFPVAGQKVQADSAAAEAKPKPQSNSNSWLTFGGDPAASQINTSEQSITAATVGRLHRGWTVALPDLADERPILVRNLSWPDGRSHDVLYLTTDKGTLLAIDAATGAQLWATTPKSTNPKYTKSSPAADPANNLVYSYGLDGTVHRYRATTGQELQGNGWPVRVTQMPLSEKVSAALNLAGGYLYVTTASFSGDAPPYQGHVVAINVETGTTHVFNSLCHNVDRLLAQGECKQNGGGIWGRPGVVVDPETGNVLFAVSDGIFTANQDGSNWGDTIVAMTPDGSKVVDSYTPENYATEAFQNRDIGSVAPTLLPTIPNSNTPLLAVQGGKEGLLRLLNRNDLSGKGGPAHVGGELQTLAVPGGCPILSQPVAWQDPGTGAIWLFVADSCHINGYRVQTSAQGATSLQLAWSVQGAATSPVLAGGVLYADTSHELLALDPNSGRTLWSSANPSAQGTIGAIHWESPLVVGGQLYSTDESNQLTMYHL